MFSSNLLNLLRYNHTFGSNTIEVIAAHEATEWDLDHMQVFAFNLVDPNLEDFNNAIVSNPIEWYNLRAAKLD